MNPTRGAKLIEKMLGREYASEVRRAWRSLEPEFERYVVGFVAGEVWSRPGLPLKTRSLVTIAALAALGRREGLALNLRMAVNNGASRREIAETILQLAPYAGFPAAWEALVMAAQVFREMKPRRRRR
jgi:alkylhydroperoxidase/carboxymuconolactone decarboxylase family protein YurZ